MYSLLKSFFTEAGMQNASWELSQDIFFRARGQFCRNGGVIDVEGHDSFLSIGRRRLACNMSSWSSLNCRD